MILKAYRYRLYPTFKQKQQLERTFGAVRFVWNQLVANFNNYGTDEFVRNKSEKHIKEEHIFLNEAIAYALQQKRIDFLETSKQYFNKRRKTRLGRMKFKKRGVSRDSFRIPGQAIGYSKGINFEESRARVPKIGMIKVVIDRRFTGELRSITISKTKTGEYYVSCLVLEESKYLPNTGKEIGLDMGLTDLVITSDGHKFENPKYFRKTQAKLKKSQRHLSRKVKGSKRYNKQKIKVAKIHQKIVRQRNWYYHNISSYLVNQYDSIFVEDLNVNGMIKNRRLSKSIADAAWSNLINMIAYKTSWSDGKDFHKINRFFASSKTCHVCNHKVENLTLDVREWTCTHCDTTHDRDVNAAFNILIRGREELYGVIEDPSVESPDYSRGEVLRPKSFVSEATSMKRLSNQ